MYTWTALQTAVEESLLQQFFPDLPFAALTINMRLQSVTDWHVDARNLVFGICCVVIFSQFDHRRHGHLILKEPKVVVELQRGDVFFLPSGCVTYRNAPLGLGETR